MQCGWFETGVQFVKQPRASDLAFVACAAPSRRSGNKKPRTWWRAFRTRSSATVGCPNHSYNLHHTAKRRSILHEQKTQDHIDGLYGVLQSIFRHDRQSVMMNLSSMDRAAYTLSILHDSSLILWTASKIQNTNDFPVN